MKILTIFLLAVTLLSVITKETNKSSETSEKIKKTEDKKSDAKNLKSEGKNTNSHKISRDINNHDIGALFPVTHVNINLQSLPHYEGFKNAEIMPRIPLSLNQKLNTGEIYKADETQGKRLYYDGRDNINAIHVNCNTYSLRPQLCVGNAQCGWCQGNNSCIPGTPAGPLAPCIKETFMYSASSPDWNPLRAGDINTKVWDDQRRSQIILATAPDLNKADVWAPYH